MITFDVQGIQELGRRASKYQASASRFPGLLQSFAQDVGSIVRDEVSHEAPVKTGALAASIGMTMNGSGTAWQIKIVSGVKYGVFVANGTSAHVIVPRQARVLAFQSGGKTVFAMRVNHPGSKANPFHVRGYQRSNPKIKARLAQLSQEVFGG